MCSAPVPASCSILTLVSPQVPINAPVKISQGKNPYDKQEQADKSKDDVAIVGQCFIDTAVYSIPGTLTACCYLLRPTSARLV